MDHADDQLHSPLIYIVLSHEMTK